MQGEGRGRSRGRVPLLALLSRADSNLLPAPEGLASRPARAQAGREWAAAALEAAEIGSRPKYA